MYNNIILTGDLKNNGTLGSTVTSENNYKVSVTGNVINYGTIKALGQGVFINNAHLSNYNSILANTYVTWNPISGYTNYIFSITGSSDVTVLNATQYLLPVAYLTRQNQQWYVVGK